MSQLIVITGPSLEPFPIPRGVSTIGRDFDAEFVLADAEISWRHARLKRDGARVVLTDLGSTNGTSINGWPLQGSQELQHNDVIRLGQIELRYDVHWPVRVNPGSGDPSATPSTGSRAPNRRVRMGRVILLAAVVQVLGWLATSAFTFIAGRAVGTPAWLLAPSVAVVGGIVQAIFGAVTGPAETNGPRPRPVRTRGVPAIVAVLTVLLIGAAGYGAALGIRYGVGYFTGTEDQVGRERLVSSPGPSGASGRVSVTVTSIVDTAHYTRVELTVTNQENRPATLWLYRNCVLTAGGVTLQADSSKSDWPEQVPPNSTQQGRVTFSGHLPDGATSAQFSFLHVFVFARFGGNDSLVIKSIRLRGS